MIKLYKILLEIRIQGNKIMPKMVNDLYIKMTNDSRISDIMHSVLIANQIERWGRPQNQNHLDWVKSLPQNTLNKYYTYLEKIAKDRNINEIQVQGSFKPVIGRYYDILDAEIGWQRWKYLGKHEFSGKSRFLSNGKVYHKFLNIHGSPGTAWYDDNDLEKLRNQKDIKISKSE